MQALVQYSKKLEPLPERFKDLDRGAFTVPECMTRVDIIPEFRDGKLHFKATFFSLTVGKVDDLHGHKERFRICVADR